MMQQAQQVFPMAMNGNHGMNGMMHGMNGMNGMMCPVMVGPAMSGMGVHQSNRVGSGFNGDGYDTTNTFSYQHLPLAAQTALQLRN